MARGYSVFAATDKEDDIVSSLVLESAEDAQCCNVEETTDIFQIKIRNKNQKIKNKMKQTHTQEGVANCRLRFLNSTYDLERAIVNFVMENGNEIVFPKSKRPYALFAVDGDYDGYKKTDIIRLGVRGGKLTILMDWGEDNPEDEDNWIEVCKETDDKPECVLSEPTLLSIARMVIRL